MGPYTISCYDHNHVVPYSQPYPTTIPTPSPQGTRRPRGPHGGGAMNVPGSRCSVAQPAGATLGVGGPAYTNRPQGALYVCALRCICRNDCTHTYINLHIMYVCAYAHMYMYTYVCTCLYTYTCLCVCM